jgi:hypothetical protein
MSGSVGLAGRRWVELLFDNCTVLGNVAVYLLPEVESIVGDCKTIV